MWFILSILTILALFLLYYFFSVVFPGEGGGQFAKFIAVANMSMSVADWEQSKTRLTIQKNVFFKMTAIIKHNWSRVELSGLASLSRKSFGDNCKIASLLHHIIPALLILNQFPGVNISTTFILSCSTTLWVFFLCIKVCVSACK